MKKTALLLTVFMLPVMLFAQNPWQNFMAIVNNTGNELVRTIIRDRVTNEVYANEEISLPPGESMQIELEGLGDVALNLFAWDAEGVKYSAFNIDPKKDAFILVEPRPTYYSAAPNADSEFRDLINGLSDTTWLQLKKAGDTFNIDPDSTITFAYTANGDLAATASFLSKILIITDGEYLEDENIIVLYTESVPDDEGNVELMDIYMNFNNLPEGIAAFQFGDNEDAFIFAPVHLLMDKLEESESEEQE